MGSMGARMRGLAGGLMLAAALSACAAREEAVAAPVAARAEALAPTFDTRADAAFGDATEALTTYLAAQEQPVGGAQHFCVVGYRQPSGDRTAQVHWIEGKRLILWEAAADPEYTRTALRDSRRDLDLTTDVAADEAALAGSTYRVTRPWLEQVLADCAAKGTSYTIAR